MIQWHDTVSIYECVRKTTRSCCEQTIALEEKLFDLNKRFTDAPEHFRATVISNLEREPQQLDKYQHIPQDPQEMKGRRTFGRGGPRIPTAAARKEKELVQNDHASVLHTGQDIQFYAFH